MVFVVLVAVLVKVVFFSICIRTRAGVRDEVGVCVSFRY
jgi:hypothetical protein